MKAASDAILRDGAWFPTKIDWAADTVIFRRVDLGAFYKVPFHDGRHGFLQSLARKLPIDSLLDYSEEFPAAVPSRLILHHSFCGSTFLARLLSQPGQTVSYREPQVLIEAAEGPTAQKRHDLTQALFDQFILAPGGEHITFIKPSNWINSFWAKSPALSGSRAVMIDMDIEDFIVANLRGGTARITYSLNLLNFALNFAPEWKRLAENAQSLLATSGMEATLRLLAILHTIQRRDFDYVMSRPDIKVLQISQNDLQRDPMDTGVSCAAWLDLGLGREAIVARYANLSSQHAKSLQPQHYRAADESIVNTNISARFAEEITSAVDWAKAQPGLQASQKDVSGA